MSEDSIYWNNLSKNMPELTDESLKNFISEYFSRRISFGLDYCGSFTKLSNQIQELVNYFDKEIKLFVNWFKDYLNQISIENRIN